MPRERYEEQLRTLDDHVLRMGDLVAQTIGECIEALETVDAARAQGIIEADEQIDSERHDIENEAVLLIATQQPMATDLRTIVAILAIVIELERIGDYCEGIARLTLRLAAEQFDGHVQDICAMAQVTQQLLRQSLEAYRDRDLEAAGRVWDRDSEVDALYGGVFRTMLLQMTTERTTIRRGTYLLWVAHNLERMADRVTNIAEKVAFTVTGDVPAFRDRLRSQTVPVNE